MPGPKRVVEEAVVVMVETAAEDMEEVETDTAEEAEAEDVDTVRGLNFDQKIIYIYHFVYLRRTRRRRPWIWWRPRRWRLQRSWWL